MSLTGTRVKETESLFFGLAELFIGDSATNETSTTAVLAETNYFSCLSSVSFIVNKEFINRYGYTLSMKTIIDHLLVGSSLEVNVEFIELTQKNLSYSLGGDGTGTNFLTTLFIQPTALRLELVFTYPNKTNSMTLVFPKTKVIAPSVLFDFESESPMKVPMTFSVLPSTVAEWATIPMGKAIFT